MKQRFFKYIKADDISLVEGGKPKTGIMNMAMVEKDLGIQYIISEMRILP